MNPSFNTVSQFAHFGVAYALTLSILIAGGRHSMYWFIPAAVSAAVFKEFWYDYHFETAEVRGSSLEDFIFYMLGIIGAILFWVLLGGSV